MNTQPWEFFVITGQPLEKIKTDNIAALRAGTPPKPEHALSLWPKETVFRRRQVDLGKQLFTLMEIPRGDMEQRIAWMERGFRYFDAPAAIIITYDDAFTPPGPLLDIGAQALLAELPSQPLEHFSGDIDTREVDPGLSQGD